MPNPFAPVVLCSEPTCQRELTRAERHAWCEQAGRCDGCHAHALRVTGLSGVLLRAGARALTYRRAMAEAALLEAATHAWVLDREALEGAGDWTAELVAVAS